jgi:peptidoglycan/LPS O-acetylase OafA/YrhL
MPVILITATTFLSDLTYPLYLVHTIGYDVLGHTRLLSGRGIGVVLSVLAVFMAAIVLHLTIERPVLALRTKLLGVGAASA